MDLERIRDRIKMLIEEREWSQFHTPQNLAISLSLEASELLEHFQWTRTDESTARLVARRSELQEELADIAIYLIELSDLAGIDLENAILEKLDKNSEKYPVALSRGNAKKYTEL